VIQLAFMKLITPLKKQIEDAMDLLQIQ